VNCTILKDVRQHLYESVEQGADALFKMSTLLASVSSLLCFLNEFLLVQIVPYNLNFNVATLTLILVGVVLVFNAAILPHLPDAFRSSVTTFGVLLPVIINFLAVFLSDTIS
jgi:hypothetical protein